MRKIVKIGLILFSVMCIITKVYAASCAINLQTAKNEFSKNEEFVVDVNLSNIQAESGIIALIATLEYDKKSLTLVGMTGQNSWSTPASPLSYNEANGKLVMDRGGLATTDEVVLKMTFKVNEGASGSTSVTLKNISTSNGIEDIAVPNTTKTITVKNGSTTPDTPTTPDKPSTPDTPTTPDTPSTPSTPVTPTQPTNPSDNNSNGNGGNSNNNGGNSSSSGNTGTNKNENKTIVASTSNNPQKDSMKKGILPKAGAAVNIILILIGVAVVFVAIFYIKIKIIDRKMNGK